MVVFRDNTFTSKPGAASQESKVWRYRQAIILHDAFDMLPVNCELSPCERALITDESVRASCSLRHVVYFREYSDIVVTT